VIIVELNERGVDLGVSYRGHLLFDYRPGGVASKERIAEIVRRHLERIQRYCNRYFRFASGQISRVFLCGDPTDIQRVQQQFADHTELSAEVLDPRAVCPDWEYDKSFADDTRYIGPLGCALVDMDQLQLPQAERGLTDLMDYFRQAWREPLLPALTRIAWPVAATILLAIAGFAFAFYQHGEAAAVERETATMETVRGRARQIKLQLEQIITKVGYLESIDSQVLNPAWNELVGMIGHCLPKRTWLESVRVDHAGSVSVTGTAETEDAVFEFVRYLKKVPILDNVNLEAQRPTRVKTGPAISFDVRCDFVSRPD